MNTDELKSRYESVKEKIEAAKNGRSQTVTLIAVSKKQRIEKIEALYELGHRDFGENYVQDLVSKAEHFKEKGITDIRWHFIGNLQRNKINPLLPHVAVIHTVDREGLAQALNDRWNGEDPLEVFAQVNIDEEDSKSGITPVEMNRVPGWFYTLENLKLKGLMCIPAAAHEDGSVAFQKLAELAMDHLSDSAQDLSMGMSGDFELAISNGASYVRVGTGIFGEREAP